MDRKKNFLDKLTTKEYGIIAAVAAAVLVGGALMLGLGQVLGVALTGLILMFAGVAGTVIGVDGLLEPVVRAKMQKGKNVAGTKLKQKNDDK